MADLSPTPYVTDDAPLVLNITPGTVKAYRVCTSDGEVLGHFDTEADAGNACRQAMAAAARVVGRVAI
jgi:hypothetical protein